MEPVLFQIGQVHVAVKDVQRGTVFCRDQLGLRHLFSAPPGLSVFDCGGVRLMLSRPEGASQGTSILYFRVTDPQHVYHALRGRGVRFEGPPHITARLDTYDLWMAFFTDSEDNMMALMSEVPRTSPPGGLRS